MIRFVKNSNIDIILQSVKNFKGKNKMGKKILKSPILLTLVGTGVVFGSFIASGVKSKEAQAYVDEAYQKNPGYVEILQDREESLWDTYMKGAISTKEFTKKLEETNSLGNKINIINENGNEDDKLQTKKILKQRKTADGFRVFGACLFALGALSFFISGCFHKPENPEDKFINFNSCGRHPKSNIENAYEDKWRTDIVRTNREPIGQKNKFEEDNELGR